MAFVGYPSGSMQSPQSRAVGGAMVPVTSSSQAISGTQGMSSASFEDLLKRLKDLGPGAAALLGNVTKYGYATAPGVSNLLGGLTNQDLGQALTGGTQVAAGAGATRLSRPVGRFVEEGAKRLLPGPLKLAAPFLGGTTQALLGTGAAQLTGKAAEIPGAVANAVTGAQDRTRERGESPGLIPGTGKGVGQMTEGELRQVAELLRLSGVDIPAEQYKALMPLANQMKDRDMQRQMQLNQQLGQLTGALDRQQYSFQLAGGAQSEAGANLRTMMTSNPYGSSVFRR